MNTTLLLIAIAASSFCTQLKASADLHFMNAQASKQSVQSNVDVERSKSNYEYHMDRYHKYKEDYERCIREGEAVR